MVAPGIKRECISMTFPACAIAPSSTPPTRAVAPGAMCTIAPANSAAVPGTEPASVPTLARADSKSVTAATGRASKRPRVTAKSGEDVTDETRDARRAPGKDGRAKEAARAPERPTSTEEAEREDRTPETGTWLIVAKAVRSHLKNHELSMHCGADALPALNAKLVELINDAIQRASANGRKTLKQSDF